MEYAYGGDAFFCSGTMVATNVFLTAAHCFEANVNQETFDIHVLIGHNAKESLRDELATIPGVASYTPITGDPQPVLALTGNAANVIVHPQHLFGASIGSRDVALVVLDTALPDGLVTTIDVLAAGLVPSPPLSPQLNGLAKWNGIYLQILGGGDTDAACTSGAISDIGILDSLVHEPVWDLFGPTLTMSGSRFNPGPSVCGGDSGGPIVTSPNGQFGTNLPNFDLVSLVAIDTEYETYGVLEGPVLNDPPIRNWLVANALDTDGDGLEPGSDNCDTVANVGQSDIDGDGWGDACDTDDDGDSVPDDEDNCPEHANPDQVDWDQDGIGWECDPNEHDLDGDYVPNADDNCPWHANSQQENCNALAEELEFGFSNGTELGDACDPVPCASTRLHERTFVAQTFVPLAQDGHVCIEQRGRSIQDLLDVRPMVGADDAALPTSDLEVWFCPCEEADATACTEPPWNCELAPYAALDSTSGWLSVSLVDSQDASIQVPQPLATTYQPWVQYPQPSELFGWDYQADYQQWVTTQQLWTPTPSATLIYGAGTDMRGLLWIEDPTEVGKEAHGAGLCSGGNCSLASAYIADVAPDRATSVVSCEKIPDTAPAPWWLYCPQCLDAFELPFDHVVNPAALTIFDHHALLWSDAPEQELGEGTAGHALDITAAFGEEVLEILGDSGSAIVGPSEPVDAALKPGQARAFVLKDDGSAIVGQLELGEAGFSLRRWDAETPLSGRSGFAASYSATEDALFIAGGTVDEELVAELWRLDAGDEWSLIELDVDAAPADAVSSMWSAGDGHLWVIDRDGGDQLRLLRIDPATGHGTVAELEALDEATDAWLVQLATHQVMLVTTNEDTHRVTLLAATEGSVEAQASIDAEGGVVAPPVVRAGVLTVPLLARDEEREWIEPSIVPLAELTG